ncbi:MAG: hypothetical protein IT291_11415 [Deltaproteobacteria bacterium]|nr:hypothetical protein [Deltaproteobacteria bacterium]
MPLKFRLKGLAETFVEKIRCNECGNEGSSEEHESFCTNLSRVTIDGIVVVAQCEICKNIFVPEGQRAGIIDPKRLRQAVEKDCHQTGQPLNQTMESIKLDVERLNALRNNNVH